MNQFSFDRPFSYPDGVSIDAMYGPWDNVSGLVTMVQNDFGFDAPKDGTEFAIKSTSGVKVYVWDSKVTPDANGYTYKEIGGGASAEQLAAKQDKLSEEQLLAVNSGITKPKIATYDGYASSISNLQTGLNTKQANLNDTQMSAVNSGVTSTKVGAYDSHVASTNNPHNVTKSQIGLGNVDNTSDADKPISTAVSRALQGKQSTLSPEQMSAVNSGVSQSKVSKYDGYESQINAMQTAVDNAVSSAGSAATSASSASASAASASSYASAVSQAISSLPEGSTTMDAKVAENTARITVIDKRVESISNESYSDGTQFVSIETDEGIKVVNVDEGGVNVIGSIRKNGEEVLVLSDAYSKQDKLIAGNGISIAEDGKTISASGIGELSDFISKETTFLSNEEQVFFNDSETEVFARIGSYGIKSKAFLNLNGTSALCPTFFENIKNIKILCIGDSLTEGDYGSEPEGTANVHQENYPYYLQKHICCSVTNKGKCGATAQSWWSTYARSIDYTQYDVAIIMLGTNNAIPNSLSTDVEPFSSYDDYIGQDGYLCKIIEYIYSVNNGIQIILCTPPYASETKRLSYYNNAKNSNDGVKAIGRRYSIPVKDMFYEGNVSKYNTDTMQPIDGLHFGNIGYQHLASTIASFLISNLSTKIN